MIRWRHLTIGLALLALLGWNGGSRADSSGPARHVVVGLSPYPPYEFLDKDGQPAGYNVDLTKAIAEVMGLSIDFRFAPWAENRAALQSGEIDILQGISYTEERTRTLEFTPSHAIIHQAIFARRGTPNVATFEELRGKRVAVFRKSFVDETLSALDIGPGLKRAPTPGDGLRMLAAGEVDYAVMALLPGLYIIRESKLTNLAPVARSVAAVRYGFAVKKGNTELLGRFNEGLAILKQTGRYDEIRARWLGLLEAEHVDWWKVLRYGAFVVFPLLLLLGGTFLWSRSLQRLVAQRTASLAREVLERKRSEEQLAREVGERKRSEEELRVRQQQLVQADKMAALGVLVSGVAHEINNPNALVLLNVPTVKEAFLDACDLIEAQTGNLESITLAGLPYPRMRDRVPRLIDEILAGGRRINHIVSDLKNFARPEDRSRFEPLALNSVVSAAIRLTDSSIRKATTRFHVELAADDPLVRGDPVHIEQVVVNLLVNALQALPDRDRGVHVLTRRDPEARRVVLEVTDEGVGIPAEHLHSLTNPFFTTKRTTGGTGLGLYVSAGIVKEHGGVLEFQSAVGVGTTAILSLPELREVSA